MTPKCVSLIKSSMKKEPKLDNTQNLVCMSEKKKCFVK